MADTSTNAYITKTEYDLILAQEKIKKLEESNYILTKAIDKLLNKGD